jgi:hypothetical protein
VFGNAEHDRLRREVDALRLEHAALERKGWSTRRSIGRIASV